MIERILTYRKYAKEQKNTCHPDTMNEMYRKQDEIIDAVNANREFIDEEREHRSKMSGLMSKMNEEITANTKFREKTEQSPKINRGEAAPGFSYYINGGRAAVGDLVETLSGRRGIIRYFSYGGRRAYLEEDNLFNANAVAAGWFDITMLKFLMARKSGPGSFGPIFIDRCKEVMEPAINEEQHKKLADLLGYCPYDIREDKRLQMNKITKEVEKLVKTVREIISPDDMDLHIDLLNAIDSGVVFKGEINLRGWEIGEILFDEEVSKEPVRLSLELQLDRLGYTFIKDGKFIDSRDVYLDKNDYIIIKKVD